ncbi:MAG TPA: acyl-CoA dehydrogenase family protein [Planctomycetota bacterium]|nr:acyl-CoA dehydrogenase family protein [Planctomycetota bacterium]
MRADDPNIPRIEIENLFEEDPVGEKFFEWWLGTTFLETRKHFLAMGKAGMEAIPLAARADRLSPVLRTHDAAGERINRVEYHPDYRELERLSYGSGIVALKYEEAFLAKHRAHRQLVGFGAAYYFAQGEMGLFCPICMTDGVARVLELHANSKVAKETIEHLTTRNMAELWQGAMFLTERQGGSDVGANRVTAHQEHGRWFLNGDKWFCSNVDAEAVLVLARLPAAPDGTRGLGLFLVLRKNPPKNEQTIVIHRLKDKLGVRSMPTGEVTFQGTEAHLVGGVGEGFKMMADMLNTSRLYNAVASAAIMRRATMEALAYGAQREAFGRVLWGLPLWRSTMADVVAEQLGFFVLTFEAVRCVDRADGGDEDSKKLARLLVPMAKVIGGKLAVATASECLEAVGGNAYIEESVFPRLLRDAQVLPVWEGTSSILTLDCLRVIKKESAQTPFYGRAATALAAAAKVPALKDYAAKVESRIEKEESYLVWLSGQTDENVQRGARQWLESAGRSLTLALLLEAATHAPLSAVCVAAFRRLLARPFATLGAISLDGVALADTESELLRAGYTPQASDGL